MMKAEASSLVDSSGTVNASSMESLTAAMASASGLDPEWVTVIVRNSTGHIISESSTEAGSSLLPAEGRALSEPTNEVFIEVVINIPAGMSETQVANRPTTNHTAGNAVLEFGHHRTTLNTPTCALFHR